MLNNEKHTLRRSGTQTLGCSMGSAFSGYIDSPAREVTVLVLAMKLVLVQSRKRKGPGSSHEAGSGSHMPQGLALQEGV